MSKKMFAVPLLIAGITVGGVAGVMVSPVFAASSNTNQSSNWGNLMGGSYGSMTTGSSTSQNSNGWSGMMDGAYGVNGSTVNGNGFAGMMGGSGSGFMSSVINHVFSNVPKISAVAAAQVAQTALNQANVSIDKTNNSITYSGQDVNIVALAGPTGADQKFVIDGLVNPTLHIQKGAKVSFQLINEDAGMPHGVEITSAKPPFSYMSMMQGGIYGGSFIHPIPAATKAGDPTLTTTFTASQAGTFTYLCQYPGHAQQGMYGQIMIS